MMRYSQLAALPLALLIGLAAPAPAAARALTAAPTSSPVLVDGARLDFGAYNIEGSNYFKLRDIAYVLSGTPKRFDVSWDAGDDAILLSAGKSYKAVGGEMAGKASNGPGTKTPVPTSSKILLDGKAVSFAAYNIDGSNYFRLRDIGRAFDFGVAWDAARGAVFIDTSAGYAEADAPAGPMSVSSSGVAGGVLADAYGKRGRQQKDNVPTRSLPVTIKNPPGGAVCYALVMLDADSEPLCGYAWVHWLAADITDADIPGNASIDDAANMIQGKNDFGAIGYGGPTPPDKPHTYTITVYALDVRLDLKNGFSRDELLKAMAGHIVAQAELDARYGN